MTTRLFAITAVALAAALSACAASAQPTRVAMAQPSRSPLSGMSTGPAIDCGDDNGGFNAPDAMKLPKAAFGSCAAQ